ncbi:NlpC/P60 family protein [Methylobacterium organophilum]|uniref:NlpC/P60 domain-containing protein n=1 Tax=Methylobacterium organophilum TaxID=410 RepID=A0ABQ4TGC1_METOR|nr:NlpC/P60 family protein [Methylobacterium organophilum]GJE29496.1 hypothetical protein LKMONMHP_4377 [Methylobacterium organophilum]
MPPASPRLRERIVAAARGWIGTPYRHQACLKGVGCDCLGLVRGVWAEIHGAEPEVPPPYPAGWAEAVPGGRDLLAEAARRHLIPIPAGPGYRPTPGDVLLFAFRAHLPAKHCAIATGPEAMVHAQDGAAVTEIAFTPWWRRHLAAAFRFPDREEPR